MSASSIFLGQVFTRKSFAFAGNSLLLYDYLITFSLEVTYVWDAPWSFVKALFLINRYGNLIGQSVIMLEEAGYLSHGSQKFCMAFGLYMAFFGVISGESTRLLVVMRACAILGCKRSITMLAVILYVLCAAGILLGSTSLAKHGPPTQSEHLPAIDVCFVPMPPNLWLLWIIPLSLDTFILVIVSYSLYRATRWTRSYSSSPLIRLLARDALWFYFAALFNVLFFIICWTVYRVDPRNMLSTLFSFPILSVVGQRLILNLRRFRLRPETTRDLSREVHRQVAAVGEGRSGGALEPGVELEELGGARTAPRFEWPSFTVDTRTR